MHLPPLYVDERRALFRLLLGNGLAQGLMTVASASLVMRIFDRLSDQREGALLLLAGLGLVIVCNAFLRGKERVLAERIGQDYVGAVRRRLYDRVLSTNPRRFVQRRRGSLLLKFVGDLSALRRWISLGLARLLVAGVAVSIALAALAWMYWPFAIGVATVLLVSASWILWQGAALRAAIADARRCQANLSANVAEKLGNLATVQAFGQARREGRFLQRQSDRLSRSSIRKAARIGAVRAAIDATAGSCVLVVLALACLSPQPELTPGMLAAVIGIIGFLTPPLRDLGRTQEYWLAAQVAGDNLRAIAKRSRRLRTRRGGQSLAVTEGRITFEAVSVRGALRAVCADAAGGARVAVVGPNGSGKSTLLNLVGRFFDPDKGRVLIDGQDIARVQLSSLRRQIGYVSADLPLIRGSLRKNLCYGAHKAGPERIRQVLDACELHELVDRIPSGLNGRIAESGADLSQGERVKVALARALLSGPRILLLDEADANLDSGARCVLRRLIQSFPGTVLVATHRNSALASCDAVWRLNGGRLHRQGPVGAAHCPGSQVVTLRHLAPAGHMAVRQ